METIKISSESLARFQHDKDVLPNPAQIYIELPNGELKDIYGDLECFGDASGFDWRDATLGECSDFLADWYGNEYGEEFQAKYSRDYISFIILDGFVTIELDIKQCKLG